MLTDKYTRVFISSQWGDFSRSGSICRLDFDRFVPGSRDVDTPLQFNIIYRRRISERSLFVDYFDAISAPYKFHAQAMFQFSEIVHIKVFLDMSHATDDALQIS